MRFNTGGTLSEGVRRASRDSSERRSPSDTRPLAPRHLADCIMMSKREREEIASSGLAACRLLNYVAAISVPNRRLAGMVGKWGYTVNRCC